MVQMWREALKRVADISGYDLYLKNRSETEVVQEIVKEISTKLSLLTPMNLIGLLGLDSPTEELKRLIGCGSNVCMIGICGMGGIGKTTIARVIYRSIYLEFDGSSFLANVGENSGNDKKIISFQKQLLYETLKGTNINIFDVNNGTNEIRRRLHNKKVLVIIDDVTHVSQLRNLAAERDWFGLGSKIIITTRDEKLLFGVDQVYKVKLLNHDDSLQLFSLDAFKKCEPPKDYLELSESVIKYCCGLPLALKVLGCSFCGNSNVDDWKSAIERLRKEPEDEIINKLKISFDGLSRTEKKIFLDIACFFKGENRSRVTRILDACGFHSTIGISILIQRHLINIEYNTLWMHDLVQEMGREIIKRESPDEIGKRSRLWEKEDVYRLFRDNMGSEVIEGIMVEEDLDAAVSAEAFSKMSNLRLLKIKNLQLREGTLNRLSNNLRLLEWYGYPLKSLPSSLELDKLVELKLHHSNIKSLWKGIKQLSFLRTISLKNCQNLLEIPKLTCAPNLLEFFIEGCPKLCGILSSFQVHKQFIPLEQLTSVRIENCQKLMEIPDLACFPNLRELYIIKCATLSSIHPPLLVLENLGHLEVVKCTRLKSLPSKIHLKSLKYFKISGCSKLENFPEVVGRMNDLIHLTIDGTAIKDIPLPDGLLPRLARLHLANNSKLVTLPSTLSGLKSLSRVSIQGCSKLENVQEALGQVESLSSLHRCGTAITQLMSSTFLMKNLDMLSFSGNQGSPSKSYFPSSLMPRSTNAITLMLPSLSGSACSLRILNLRNCNLEEGDIPCDFFASLISLKELYLNSNNFVSLPTTINRLSKLERLYMNNCKRLQSLTELPSSTYEVALNGCASLETLSGAFKLRQLGCVSCFKLLGVNHLMFSMLKDYLKGRLPKERNDFSGSYFSMVAPGDEVPEWITHRGMDSSITMERPPDFHNNKLVGVVACCVFVFNSHFFSKTNVVDLRCKLFQDGEITCYGWHSVEVKPCNSMSEHLWLLCFRVNKYDRLRISFSSYSDPPGVEWKICGAHPIYERDLNDLDLATSNWSSSSLGKLNESPQEYFSASEEPSDSDGDEALESPQEYFTTLTESSDSHGDEPELKRFKSV